MKRCPFCNAQLKDDSLFCTECGKELPQGRVCPHCGASVNDSDEFCQNCGKKLITGETLDPVGNNDKEIVDTSSKSKFIIPIVIGVVVLALIGGGWYFFGTSDTAGKGVATADSAVVESDSLIVEEDISDIYSEAYILHRMQDICDKVPSTPTKTLINNYFSESFRKLYKAVSDEYMKDREGDDVGYFGFYFWSSEGNIEDFSIHSVKVLRVDNLTDSTALVTVQDLVKSNNIDELKRSKQLKLVFENDDWFIDDINNHKNSMEEFLSSNEMKSQEELASTNTAIGAFRVEDDSIE